MGTAVDWELVLLSAGIEIVGIDVGCSGGMPYRWERLGRALRYVGVDPLTTEVERLQASAKAKQTFIAAFVDCPGGSSRTDKRCSDLFQRTSAAEVQRNGYDVIKENFNGGRAVAYTDRHIDVDTLLRESECISVDLLKIDIDGDDFPCFRAFTEHPAGQRLGLVEIESQFHGDLSPDGNTFDNIARLARSMALDLYDLSPYRYSRAALPGKFIFDFPAQTHNGQVMWADAVFARDLFETNADPQEVVKIAALLSIYDLDDCAFELLQNQQSRLKDHIDIALILEKLETSNNAYLASSEVLPSGLEPAWIRLLRAARRLWRSR